MVVLGDLPNGRIQRFWNGQIVMVDLPRWKMWRFFKVIKNTNDFSKWSYCNKQLVQVKHAKIFQSGEKYEWFFKVFSGKNAMIFFRNGEKYKWFFKMVLL